MEHDLHSDVDDRKLDWKREHPDYQNDDIKREIHTHTHRSKYIYLVTDTYT